VSLLTPCIEEKVYREEIQGLYDILKSHGIDHSSYLHGSEPEPSLTSISLHGDSWNTLNLRASLPPVTSSGTVPASSLSLDYHCLPSGSEFVHGSGSPHIDECNTAVPHEGLDTTQLGINFILALENPCFHHHKIPSPELLITGSIGGTGHQQMLSSPIMARSPKFSFSPLSFGYSSEAEWTVPTAELESLLNLSPILEGEEELTPVQGWYLIRNHPIFNQISPENLQSLSQALLPDIKCYGSAKKRLSSFFGVTNGSVDSGR
jgi:hypothetical protein